ncbi:hypothetical protein MH215_20295 [Paenibacillus sp. ACRSA]|uniref:hypothetical protein n=1 Tax=Paenibacillus sp. ACRSA TaxID=2918211 RepID=UPI001EF602C8|nr:hypothetical protein [Paenibacillus sp. ACRSA]MCG7379345.1 hypothetical protein [Paenibacillus sp. ACRSA]
MGDISLETIGSLIGTVGFPILVAIILLRTVLGDFNKRLDTLDQRLVQLNKSINLVAKTLKEEPLSKRSIETVDVIEKTNKKSD